MTSDGKYDPFRATTLWKEAISSFRCIPTKKHRRGFRVYEDCFTGEEAVIWLLQKLYQSKNFGSVVTWEQTKLLLEKFYLAGVFTTCGEATSKFKPNNTLYKISARAALKTVQLPMSGILKQNTPVRDIAAKRVLIKAEAVNKMEQAEKVREEVMSRRDCWKEVVYNRLQQLIDGVDLSKLLPSYEVNGYFIVENALIPRYFTLAEELEHSNLKSWLIGAMRNLSNDQPTDKIETHMASYANFQHDVFIEIANYFKSQPCLIPPELSKAILGSLDYLLCRENTVSWTYQEEEDFFVDSKSTEDLLLNMSMWPVTGRNPFLTENAAIESESPCLQDKPLQNCLNGEGSSSVKTGLNPFKTDTGEWIKSGDLSLEKLPSGVCWDWESMLPKDCVFETEFVTEIPVTRVVPRPEKKHVLQSLITPQQQYESITEAVPISSGKTPQPTTHRSSMLDTPLPTSSPHTRCSTVEELSTGKGYDEMTDLPIDTHLHEARDEGKTPKEQLNFSPRPSESLLKKRKRKSQKYNLSGILTLATTPLSRIKSSAMFQVSPHSEFSETTSLLDQAYINDDTGGVIDFESMNPMSRKNCDGLELTKPVYSCDLNVDMALESVMKLVACSMESPPPIHNPEHIAEPSVNTTPSFVTSPAIKQSHSTPYCNIDSSFNLELSKITSTPDISSPKPNDCSNPGSAENVAEKLRNMNFDTLDTNSEHHKIELLHLMLLTLPPANRARLSLLLTFMNSVIYKEDFSLHPILSNVTMVINSFKASIMYFDEDEDILLRNPTLLHDTVKLFLEHKDALFSVPSDLFDEVQQTLSDMQELRLESSHHKSKLHQDIPAYCERVSQQEFEKQRLRDSEMALIELLEQIAEDRNMPMKEKRQRLKDFSEQYPHLYKKRFPTEEEETKVLRPTSKSKSLLSRIKTLRL